MKNPSHWAETKTFFPLLIEQLEQREKVGRACIVGASDGKFVLPLARRDWKVTALDVDETALKGGPIEFPKGNLTQSVGLLGRLQSCHLDHLVEIILGDLYEFAPQQMFDVIFTSCSWHYSRNHHRPLRDFVHRMQQVVAHGGIFCAEYMMPVEAKHFLSEHYLHEGQLRQYFPSDEWQILEEFYTSPFCEKAHIGNLADHVHRMGFFMAKRIAPLA
ncbi:MAG: class I SAM-dependent methyltransferase [Minisyncoccia bacterium]